MQGNPQRSPHSFLFDETDMKIQSPLERIHVFNVTFVCICGNYIYFPYLESRRDRENIVKFSKSTVTSRFFHIPISLSFEILSGMRLHRSHEKTPRESLDVSGSTDWNEGHVCSDTSCLRHQILGRNFHRSIPRNQRDDVINHGQVSL